MILDRGSAGRPDRAGDERLIPLRMGSQTRYFFEEHEHEEAEIEESEGLFEDSPDWQSSLGASRRTHLNVQVRSFFLTTLTEL